MKTLGIIGGIGPESTIEYYRQIVATYRERRADGSFPAVVINSNDLNEMLKFMADSELEALTAFLGAEVHKLALAGAHVGRLAANTPHVVFEELSVRSAIPLDDEGRGIQLVAGRATSGTCSCGGWPPEPSGPTRRASPRSACHTSLRVDRAGRGPIPRRRCLTF